MADAFVVRGIVGMRVTRTLLAKMACKMGMNPMLIAGDDVVPALAGARAMPPLIATAECVMPTCVPSHDATMACRTEMKGRWIGGSCGACPLTGSACGVSLDCLSGVCTNNLCAAPACNDGVQNGDETNVDCGGRCAECAIPNPDYANYSVIINRFNSSGYLGIEWADGQAREGILAGSDPEPMVVNCGRPAYDHGVVFEWTRVGDCIEPPAAVGTIISLVSVKGTVLSCRCLSPTTIRR